MAYITVDEDEIFDGEINVEISYYLDEVDTDDLIQELSKRRDIPKRMRFLMTALEETKTPIRDSIIAFLNIHSSATVEDIQQAVKECYYK